MAGQKGFELSCKNEMAGKIPQNILFNLHTWTVILYYAKVGNIGLLVCRFREYNTKSNSQVSERYFTAKFTVVKYQFSRA